VLSRAAIRLRTFLHDVERELPARRVHGQHVELECEALAQIARGNSARLERLTMRKAVSIPRFGTACKCLNLLERLAQEAHLRRARPLRDSQARSRARSGREATAAHGASQPVWPAKQSTPSSPACHHHRCCSSRCRKIQIAPRGIFRGAVLGLERVSPFSRASAASSRKGFWQWPGAVLAHTPGPTIAAASPICCNLGVRVSCCFRRSPLRRWTFPKILESDRLELQQQPCQSYRGAPLGPEGSDRAAPAPSGLPRAENLQRRVRTAAAAVAADLVRTV